MELLMTESSQLALERLRSTDNLQWYIIPILIFVIYVYLVEIEKGRWGAVLVGVIAYAVEFIWEMFNASILHFTQYAPLWSTPHGSSFLIYTGYNIEISALFAVAGIFVVKSLPADRKAKILGLPNRIVIPVILGLICVATEITLNLAGFLVWDYSWWIALTPVIYITPWFVTAYLYDNTTLRTKKITALVVVPLAICCHILFALVLQWI
jgi:hypothetical protein